MDEQRPNDRMLERTLLFVTLSIGILWFQSYLMSRNRPQPEKPAEQAADLKAEKEPSEGEDKPSETAKPTEGSAEEPEADEQIELPTRYATLGSADPASPYRMLVTLDHSRGGGRAGRTEQSRDTPVSTIAPGIWGTSSDNSGLAEKECLVQTVGAGTPAEEAGMKPGDLITSVGGEPVTTPFSLTLGPAFDEAWPERPDRSPAGRKDGDPDGGTRPAARWK